MDKVINKRVRTAEKTLVSKVTDYVSDAVERDCMKVAYAGGISTYVEYCIYTEILNVLFDHDKVTRLKNRLNDGHRVDYPYTEINYTSFSTLLSRVTTSPVSYSTLKMYQKLIHEKLIELSIELRSVGDLAAVIEFSKNSLLLPPEYCTNLRTPLELWEA